MNHQYSGFFSRLGALILTTLSFNFVLQLVSIAVYSTTLFIPLTTKLAIYIISALSIVLYLYMYIFYPANNLGEIGKKISGIEMIRVSGERRISYLRCFCRLILAILSAFVFCIGHLVAIFHPKKRALHDIIVGTIVVKKEGVKSRFWQYLIILLASNIGVFFIVFIIMSISGLGSVGDYISDYLTNDTNKVQQQTNSNNESQQVDSSKRKLSYIAKFDNSAINNSGEDFSTTAGPFTIYAKKTYRDLDFINLTVFTQKIHDNVEMDDFLSLPRVYIEYVLDKKGRLISKNTNEYEKIELSAPSFASSKKPKTSGMNGYGKVPLKNKSAIVHEIKGLVKAALPQKKVQYYFHVNKDLGVSRKINSNTSMSIEQKDPGEQSYVFEIVQKDAKVPFPFSIEFKDAKGGNLSKNNYTQSSFLYNNKRTTQYDYRLDRKVDKVVIAIPYDYEIKTYPFTLKR